MPSRKELADALRFLAADAVERAKSGHPGAPMGMADMAQVLWSDFLRHNPANPNWADRDRFVLSNGHASMLLYGLLYLTGYDVSVEDLKNFRQLHSKTPGHPEYGATPGVETTTGPLGQGIAMAVGMALAEKKLAQEFNREGFPIVDHYTYVFMGDGCLMEGISHEACSLAGTYGLGKLIALYDSNGISIDGKVSGWFTEDIPARFKAYGWHVVADVDGHDPVAVKRAVSRARKVTDKPSLICCKTHIGFGAPGKQDSASAHGAPLGSEELAKAREALNWPYEPFEVPKEILKAWNSRAKGKKLEGRWDVLFAKYEEAFPDLAAEFRRRVSGDLPACWDKEATALGERVHEAGESIATRVASQHVISGLVPILPELLGGSADLTGSVGTKGEGMVSMDPKTLGGDHISYGVREFAMGAIMNGIALHGGYIPYGGTFLVFSDYERNAIRLSALMRQRVIWVLTHDSIGLGEDGPTHQPVEHLPSLRVMPGLNVWRPCDSEETFYAWKTAVRPKAGPTAMVLSRQKLPFIKRDMDTARNIERGGYILKDCDGLPEAIIIATGSEVEIALKAAEVLGSRRIRVVSMPCTELFDAQEDIYKNIVLPHTVRERVAVEAAHGDLWRKYVGLDGAVVGMNGFGESAPAKELYKFFNITVEAVVDAVKKMIG